MYEWHGFGGGMMWIFWILILIAVIWLVLTVHHRGDHQNLNKTALEILQERYARGEISRDEFLRMRDDINQ